MRPPPDMVFSLILHTNRAIKEASARVAPLATLVTVRLTLRMSAAFLGRAAGFPASRICARGVRRMTLKS